MPDGMGGFAMLSFAERLFRPAGRCFLELSVAAAYLVFGSSAWASNVLLAKGGGVTGESRFIERGRYLVTAFGCNDCHTSGFVTTGSKPPERDVLGGARMFWGGDSSAVYATNLRAYFRDVSEEKWVEMARDRQSQSPMPYGRLNAMSTADLMAIYRYVRYLGRARGPLPF
jgi:hypothetical protein